VSAKVGCAAGIGSKALALTAQLMGGTARPRRSPSSIRRPTAISFQVVWCCRPGRRVAGALAGGNPVSYVEWDGHVPTQDNPVSGNPQLNVQLNSPDSTWSAKDRFVGCACAGLDQQVQAANQAQQRRNPAGAVGKFVGGAWDYFAGFVGGYVAPFDAAAPGPNDVAGFGGTVIRGRYVYPQNAPSYTDVYEQQSRRWGVNTSSASYRRGDRRIPWRRRPHRRRRQGRRQSRRQGRRQEACHPSRRGSTSHELALG
jgi:hypothetical protein